MDNGRVFPISMDNRPLRNLSLHIRIDIQIHIMSYIICFMKNIAYVSNIIFIIFNSFTGLHEVL